MLQFILVAGLNGVEEFKYYPQSHYQQCKVRKNELVKKYRKKDDLIFWIVNPVVGTIEKFEVTKAGKELKPITVLKKKPFSYFHSGESITIENIYNLLIKIGKENPGTLLEFSLFYAFYSLNSGGLYLMYLEDDNNKWVLHFSTDFSASGLPSESVDFIKKAYHPDGYNWLWEEALYNYDEDPGPAYPFMSDLIKDVLKLPEYASKTLNDSTPILLSRLSPNGLKRVLQDLARPANGQYYVQTGDNFKFYTIKEEINLETGYVPFSFIRYLTVPLVAPVAKALTNGTGKPTYTKVGYIGSKLENDSIGSLVYLVRDDKVYDYYENIFGIKNEKGRNYFIVDGDTDVFYGQSLPAVNKTLYMNSSLTEVDMTKGPVLPLTTGYIYDQTGDTRGMDLMAWITHMPEKKKKEIKYFINVIGLKYREYPTFSAANVYENQDLLRDLSEDQIQSVLDTYQNKNHRLCFMTFYVGYSSAMTDYYDYNQKTKKFERIYSYYDPYGEGEIILPDGTYLYRSPESDIWYKSPIGRKEINKKIKEYVDLEFTLLDKWRRVSIPEDYKKPSGPNPMKVRYAYEWQFDPLSLKLGACMMMGDIYKFISKLGLGSPGSILEFNMWALGDERGPLLINYNDQEIPEPPPPTPEMIKRLKLIPGYKPKIYSEPNSKRGIAVLDTEGRVPGFKEAFGLDASIFIPFYSSDEIYLDLIKAILHSKEYQQPCNSETIITLHRPGKGVKKFLKEKAKLVPDQSSSPLKQKYKLGELLRFFMETIKSSYMMELACMTQRKVYSGLPGFNFDYKLRYEGYARYVAPPKKSMRKYYKFYEKHFGFKTADPANYGFYGVLPDNLFTLNHGGHVIYDPEFKWLKSGLAEVKF